MIFTAMSEAPLVVESQSLFQPFARDVCWHGCSAADSFQHNRFFRPVTSLVATASDSDR
jgi:hypothetical protein